MTERSQAARRSADPAAAVVRRLHSVQNAFYAGEPVEQDLRRLLHRDICWHVPGDNAIAGDYEGIESVLSYFRRRRALAAGTFQMRSVDLLTGDGDHVASVTDGMCVIGSVEHSWTTVGLYRTAEDRVAECWLLPLDADAFDRAWTDVLQGHSSRGSPAPDRISHGRSR